MQRHRNLNLFWAGLMATVLGLGCAPGNPAVDISSAPDLAAPLDLASVPDMATPPDLAPLKEIVPCKITEAQWRLGASRSDQINWEAELKFCNIGDADTIVIHHTATDGTLPRDQQLNLINQSPGGGYPAYVDRYKHTEWDDPTTRVGEEVHSDHFNAKGEEVFYPYHQVVWIDGTSEQLLNDGLTIVGSPKSPDAGFWPRRSVGWHAGKWNWNGTDPRNPNNHADNLHSLAIVMIGNYETMAPSMAQIQGVANLLKYYRQKLGERGVNIDRAHVVGHLDVRGTTVCPGKWWTNKDPMTGKTGREQLLDLAGIP